MHVSRKIYAYFFNEKEKAYKTDGLDSNFWHLFFQSEKNENSNEW